MKKNNAFNIFIISQCVLVLCLFCVFGSFASAQDSSPTFQDKQKGFFDILSQPPKSSQQLKGARTKGLTPKSITKGPESIVKDYEKLVENPTARALILFDFDSDVIKPESYSILRELAIVLVEQLPEVRLVVAGHTDSIGDEEYNLKLSTRRALSVKNFLVSAYDIEPTRLFVEGYGELQPLATNENEGGRSQNRRVEFIRY